MAGITHRPYRRLMARLGSQFSISELVSSNGIKYAGRKTLEMLKIHEDERPVAIQLFGEDITNMTEAAKVVEGVGADFVDINFGCPVPKVVSKGGGACWLQRPQDLGRLCEAMVKSVGIPVTIKIRTGWDANSINAHEIVRVAGESGVRWVAIHGRTRSQGYSGHADWDIIESVAREAKIPVIGNGDLVKASQIRERWSKTSCSALMVGRGVLHDPLLLLESRGDNVPFQDFSEILKAYADLLFEDFPEGFVLIQLKKMAAWFSSGLTYGSQFRSRVFQYPTAAALLEDAGEFLKGKRADHRMEGPTLLMGGHG